MKSMKVIYTLIFSILTLFAAQAQKNELKLNLEVGEKYKQTTHSEMDIKQNFNGQQIDMKMGISGTMSFLVNKATASQYEMEVKYERLVLSMQMPQGAIEFSSENDNENDIFSQVLGQMIGKPFRIKMKKNGKVAEVKGIEELYSGIFERFPEVPEAQKKQLLDQLKQAYGEKAFIGNLEMVTAIFPDEPVAMGDQWTVKTQLESGMAADMVTVYEYKDKNEKTCQFVGLSTIKTKDKDAYVQTNGMPMKYDIGGEMNSEITIDSQSGWIIEAKISQQIDGNAYIMKNPQLPNGMKIPLVMKSQMVITNN